MHTDPRHITNGWEIPSEGYADQPYIVQTDDGAWLCVITTGTGHEGDPGQHVISMRSTDQGRNWSAPVAVEPADGPEASYAVLLKVPGGRIYCFYNHNTDRVREVRREDGGVFTRVDSLGHYVFKYSDDHGRSWSNARYEVPVREFACDRENVYGGALRFFWNVGRPLLLDDAALLTLHKVGAMGDGFFAQSEGVVLRSENILTETDPAKITFTTLPDGEIGLRAPAGGGRIAEEQSVVALSDGALYCVYRTVDGYPACAYSRDGGHRWTPPTYAAYTPGGRRIKHPRAANFVWRCGNGQFLYWFHNHGGTVAQRQSGGWDHYHDRNPVWLAAGREVDSPDGKVIHWSQPEILLYDDDPFIRISYPDLVETDGRFYVTETQKSIGRVHAIDPALLDGLFHQWDIAELASAGLVLDVLNVSQGAQELPMPLLPEFHTRDQSRLDGGGCDRRAGFTIDLLLRLDTLEAGQRLLDSRTATGQGVLVTTGEAGTLLLTIHDGRESVSWQSDAGCLQRDTLHQVVITVDGGPKIITYVIDGVLCDGGEERQFGWGRFSPTLSTPNGAPTLRVAPAVQHLRLYDRPLRTSEAVGNWRAVQLA